MRQFFIKLYADDTFLCAQNENVKALEDEVNYELDKVHIWLASNRLTLNIKKSKYMIISINNFYPLTSIILKWINVIPTSI